MLAMHTPFDTLAASDSGLLCRFEKTSLSKREDDHVPFVAALLAALWRLTLGKRIPNGFQTDKTADIRRANAYNGYLDFRLLLAGVLGLRCWGSVDAQERAGCPRSREGRENGIGMADYSDDLIKRVLGSVKTVAIVGVSANPAKASFMVMRYMQTKGYRCIPVNPGLAGQVLLGEKVFDDLKSIPERVDMVDIFRNSEAAGGVTDEAIAIGAKVVWMQLGVINAAAAARAEQAGLTVIMDRCPKMEYSRFSGEFGWVGRNSRIIDNRRKHLGAGRASLARDAIGRGKGTL